MLCCLCFFFKQKTAYERRISDWSSDVCSSDLIQYWRRVSTGCFRERNRGPLIRQYGNTAGSGGDGLLAKVVEGLLDVRGGQRAQPVRIARQPGEIGRASCRERVWQYG